MADEKVITYIAKDGDTVEKIAEKLYGDPSKKNIILRYNPTVHPKLKLVGKTLLAPILPQTLTSKVVDEGYSVFIGGVKIKGFLSLKLSRYMFNVVNIAEIRIPLDSDFVKIVNPLKSPTVEIYYARLRIFVGFVISSVSDSAASQNSLIVQCYSSTYKLVESLINKNYLVYEKQNVKNILEQLTSYCGLDLEYEVSGKDPEFDLLQFEPNNTCLDVALYVCKVRGYYLRSNDVGGLNVFNKEQSKIQEIIQKDEYPFVSYREEVNTEGLRNTIKVITNNTLHNDSVSYSDNFTNLPFSFNFRNYTVLHNADYGLNFDKILNSTLRQMVKNSYKLYINVSVPFDRLANPYRIGSAVKLENFNLSISEKYFIISSVNIMVESGTNSIVLGLLPKNTIENPAEVKW